MILHIEKHVPLYQKLGVFTEAPNKPKRKPRVVNGGAPGSLSDYTKDVESEEELNLDDMEMDDLEDGDMDDLTDGSDDEELETDDPAEQDEPATDDEDLTAGADDDAQGDEDGGDAPQTDAPSNADEPVTDDGDGGEGDTAEADEPATDDGDGGDLTAGADDDDDSGGDDGSDDSSTDSEDGEEKKKFSKEDMKKYILFQNLMNLHTSLDNYVSKLNSADPNNNALTRVYQETKVAFQDLQSLIYDYMLLKFSGDSYTSAVYFYEQVKAAVLILFSILEEKKEELKKEDGKTKSASKTHFNR